MCCVSATMKRNIGNNCGIEIWIVVAKPDRKLNLILRQHMNG